MQRKDSGSRPPKTQQKSSPVRGGLQNPGAAYTSGLDDAYMGVTQPSSSLGNSTNLATGYPSASSPQAHKHMNMALREPNAEGHRQSAALTWRNLEQSTHATLFQTSSYQVTFQVHRKVDFGQTIIVLGNIAHLDKWKKVGPFRQVLRWTEGDIWVSKEPLVTSEYFFHYKYAIVEDNKVIGWERGVDRVADLEILPDMRNGRLYNCPTELFYDMECKHPGSPTTKICVLNEIWEKLTVSFMVYHPSEDHNDELLFDCPRVNARNMMMHRMPREFEWMNPKYGQMMRPWQITVQFPNEEGSNTGQFKATGDAQMRYTFIRRNRVTGEQVWERDPKRLVDLQDPNTYRGQLGAARSCLWLNTDRCYCVNGCVFKADGNFLNPFFYKRIGDTWITLGSYPINEIDYQRVRTSGASAVLNIQGVTDHRQHDINSNTQMGCARCAGIQIYHNSAVDDTTIQQYCKDVFSAASLLHQLIVEQKHHVFIHCASGVSRCTTLFLVYAALYGLPNEDGTSALPTLYKHGKTAFDEHDPLSVSLDDLAAYLKMQYPKSTPNLKVVQMVIDENKAFILEQRRRKAEEEARRRKEQEERERQIALKKAQEEAERIRLMRLAEAEKERLRLQRLEQERAEQLRLERLAAEEAERERQRFLKEEEDRLRRQALADEEERLARERAIREEEMRREAEKRRLEQEAALQAEKIRLQKLAVEAAREAARIKKEQEEFDEEERRRKAQYEHEENERQRREIECEEQHQAMLAKQCADEEERRRLEQIRLQQLEAERIRLERQAYEEEELLRRKKIQEEEELERLRQKKIAEEEAHNLLLRLKCIEEEENERIRKKKEAEHEFQIQSSRLRELMRLEHLGKKRHCYDHYQPWRPSSPHTAEPRCRVSLDPVISKPTPVLKNALKCDTYADSEVAAFGDIDLLGITESELDQQCEELFSDTPVKFVPRKTNELDQKINKLVEEHNLTIPIIHIKDTLYLIGSQRLNVKQENDKISVRIGGGYERFEDYVPRNSKYFQRTLVCHMIKSGESLEWVIEQLLQGKKIKNIHLEAQNKLNEANRFRRNSYSPVSGRSTTGGFQAAYDRSGRKSPTPSYRNSYANPGFSFRKTSPYALTKSASKNALNSDYKPRTYESKENTFQKQLVQAKQIAQQITGTVDPNLEQSIDDSWRKDSD